MRLLTPLLIPSCGQHLRMPGRAPALQTISCPEETSLFIFSFTETRERVLCPILVQGKSLLLLNEEKDLLSWFW